MHRSSFYDDHHYQPQQPINEGAGFDSHYWEQNVRSGNDDKMELSDRMEWLLQLGISASYAHELALHTMEQPLFRLPYFQQYWRELHLDFGPSRKNEVDAIVLRKILELLESSARQPARRSPSPQRSLNWSSYEAALSNRSGLENYTESPINYRNAYNLKQQRASTPKNELEPDVYNIDANPRNVDRYPPVQFQTFDCNYGNTIDTMDTINTSSYQNSYVDGMEQAEFNYSTGYNDAYPNNKLINITYSGAHYQQDMQGENLYFNEKAIRLQSATRARIDVNNNNWKTYANQHRNDSRDPSSFGEVLPLNMDKSAKEQLRRRDRKRSAERGGKDLIVCKRRYVEAREDVFKIGEFTMPKIACSRETLPQPEEKSHAIRFFRMNHCFIVGGRTAPRTNDEDRAQLPFLPDYDRSIAKRIRMNLRYDWITIYRNMNYKNWYNWWKGFKWCGADIENQLLRFRGLNLEKKSFLYCKLNYDNRQEVNQLLHMSKMALEFNETNYQSILCTIFEMMNKDFLNALTITDFGKVQDVIRHIPNHLWLYKMRSMVYLWSRYSRIQTNYDNAAPHIHSMELIATKSQWNSGLFHWLAKQAYDEVKRISSREWPNHRRTFRDAYER